MIQYSGQNWTPDAPYVSAGACATTLAMTEAERSRAQRRPIGFGPSPDKPRLSYRNGHWYVVWTEGQPFIEEAFRWVMAR